MHNYTIKQGAISIFFCVCMTIIRKFYYLCCHKLCEPISREEISIKLNNYEKNYLFIPPCLTATDGECV